MSSPPQAAGGGIQMAAANGGNMQSPQNVFIGITTTPPTTERRHPSTHLLDIAHREEYLRSGVSLVNAARKGDWEIAKEILENDPTLLSASITYDLDTVLHIAAAAKHIYFVEKVVQMMDEQDLALQNDKGNTALSFAAMSGALQIAQIMVQKKGSLPTIRGGGGMTPLYIAALFGHSQMAWYLYRLTHEMLDEAARIALFFSCIENGGLYDLAMEMIKNYENLATARKPNGETALHVLARRLSSDPFGARSSSGMWSRLHSNWYYKRNNLEKTQGLQLVERVWRQMLTRDHEDVLRFIKEPSELLFDTTRSGNYEFLSVLLKSYPELLGETDHKNRTIFHVAVLHRHASIFYMVHEPGSNKDLMVQYSDTEDNNILHLAAKLAPQSQLNLVSGAALQMQRELVWFEEVKKIVPPHFIEMKNRRGKTPRELFTSEHKGLLHKGESWMKNTANSCMLVSTIIATVVFSAAFSVPGGISDKTGTPNFVKQTAFLIFAISDSVALFSSSTAILMFLFILTSRYAESDFRRSLPLKLMVGLASLFISISSMMVTFSTAFYLSCHPGLKWLPDLIFILAFVPVILFLFLQYPLLSDMFFSTYCSRL